MYALFQLGIESFFLQDRFDMKHVDKIYDVIFQRKTSRIGTDC